jgi:hypothetical protein
MKSSHVPFIGQFQSWGLFASKNLIYNGGDKPIQDIHMCIRKCHRKTPHINIKNKKIFLKKLKDRKEKQMQGLIWNKERLKDSDYGLSIMYS